MISLTSRSVQCQRCGHVAGMRLDIGARPFHCVRCNTIYDWAGAVIEAVDEKRNNVEEKVARAFNSATLASYELGQSEQQRVGQ